MSLNGPSKVQLEGTDFKGDKGFTVQADRKDADINEIIKRFEVTGQVARLNSRPPFYGDVSEFDGLADALTKVREAQDLFMTYDANVRERFDNDPVKFVEFLQDPENLKEAQDLGIVAKPPPPASAPAAPAPTPGA